MRIRVGTALVLLATSALAVDSSSAPRPQGPARTACEGLRPPLDPALFYELDAAAFPGSGGPDVAVHVPPGFDATRRPGLVLYFHGWNGCVAAALSDDDVPCSVDGEPRSGARLAAQMDEAGVNALLVAIELRVDAPSGDAGALVTRGGARRLVRELLRYRLAGPLGCALEVDAIDRIVLVAHSGGYQAAASTLAFGELPSITGVVLLDALYGATDVFGAWMSDALEAAAESPGHARRRFVDVATCCGGTLEPSLALSERARHSYGSPFVVGLAPSDAADAADAADANNPPLPLPLEDSLAAAVFVEVPDPHSALPRHYFSAVVRALFDPVRSDPSPVEFSGPGSRM